MHPVFHSARNLVAVAGLWLALSFIISYFLYLTHNIDLSSSLILFAPLIFAYFFFCISNYFICLRLPIRQTAFLRLLSTQLAGMTATLALWLVSSAAYVYILNKSTHNDWFPLYMKSLVLLSIVGAMLYCFWILAHYVYLMAEQHDHMERTELQRKLLISQTELQSVKATVHPHFLFNSLNTLANLALIDPRKVHDICLKIAEFLRYSVSYGRKKSATVGEELEHIKNYLAVEQERFGSRLKVTFETEWDIESICMPPLLLFPLVENAIKHGIDNRLEGGTLSINVKRNGKILDILIENPYENSGRKQPGESFGLESVRRRINALYGDAAALKISSDSSNFSVLLSLPIAGHVE